MSQTSKLSVECKPAAHLISFGERYVSSSRFQVAFDDGMGLVEEAANYLDGQGRADAKRLPSGVAYIYANESMRLTTRLMQIASWLLIRRSVNDGDMTPQKASNEEKQLKLIENGMDEFDEDSVSQLPLKLQDLILRSLSFHKQILQLHDMLHANGDNDQNGDGQIQQNMEKLTAAFSR